MDAQTVPPKATLAARLLDKDGNLIQDYGVISEDPVPEPKPEPQPPSVDLIQLGLILCAVMLACSSWHAWIVAAGFFVAGIITNAGINYEAAAFTGGPGVGGLNYHDSGAGTTPAAITDTALEMPAGPVRVLGTQSNPLLNVYQTVATIQYSASGPITEWGLFSASAGGAMWDHRIFSAINVVSGAKVEFTYTCTFASGGL